MWLGWGISVINDVKSGLLVVAGLLVVIPRWHWRHFPLLNLSFHTAVYLFSSRRLISYITTTAHSAAIIPLTPKGSWTMRHASMSLCFLMEDVTQALHGEPIQNALSECLGERGFAITKIISQPSKPSCVLALVAMCHWFCWHSVHALSAWRINFHYHSW